MLTLSQTKVILQRVQILCAENICMELLEYLIGCLRLVHGGSLMNIEVASGVVEFGIGLATGL